ncbi:MAG: glycosyltransferase [Paludibacter sp.]|nr:glycosyltransferase [Paludibacter sp.]
MKKILHVSKFYYPYYGGIEDVARTLIDELKPYYEQKIICFNHEKGTIYNINGADVLRVGTTCTIASQPVSIKYRRLLQDAIKSFRPDFIHLHLPNPLIASYLLTINLYGAKIITHWHADILGQKHFYPFYKPFEQKILKNSYKIITTSEMYKDHSEPLKQYLNKTYILPNTVNEHKLHLYEGEQEEIESIRHKYGNKKIVLFIGRHVAYKGIDYLIEAEKYIKQDCVILIGGTGDLNAKLKEQAGNNPRIKFIGRLSNNDMKYHLYAADVFAFPSHNRSEAFGVALAEALYCGLPAVSFNIEGSGALWVNKNNYTGIVVENKNVEKFAGAIDKILESDKLRKEFSQNGKKWVKENFLKDQIVPIMEKIYE